MELWELKLATFLKTGSQTTNLRLCNGCTKSNLSIILVLGNVIRVWLVADNLKQNLIMNTETVTVHPKGDGFEIIVHHDQTGSAYGISLSKEAYQQLRLHFVVGQNEQLACDCPSETFAKHYKSDGKCGYCGGKAES